jgi:hypothetical protein
MKMPCDLLKAWSDFEVMFRLPRTFAVKAFCDASCMRLEPKSNCSEAPASVSFPTARAYVV